MKRIICNNLSKNIIYTILKEINTKVYAIYIFGSYGTKYEREDSDVDIAVITDNKVSISNRYKLKTSLDSILNKTVDLSVIYDYNSNLMMNILSNGYLIYESDDYNILFDQIYENLTFDFYFMNTYMEELNKYV